MKKIVFVIFFLLAVCYSNVIYASNTNEVLKEQENNLGISDFIRASEKYTKENFKETNLDEFYKNAIVGKVEEKGIINAILKIVGKEVISTIRILGYVLIIVIIHSIVKNVSEGMGDSKIGEITYYVQYVLIVSLVMANFADIITLVKDTVNNLVGFLNSLLPILLALMLSTGNIITTSTTQPVLLFAITFIGNIISNILLPFILIGTALSIISKVSDKIQIDKLSKFFKSSVVWILGIVLTIFVRSIIIRRNINK